MNDIERRLHHGARELRSFDIEPPPLAKLSATRRPTGLPGRVPALVMPVLFVLGGLAVIVGGLGRTTESPDALPAVPIVEVGPVADERGGEDTDDPGAIVPSLTAHQELALIASLAPERPANDEVTGAPVSDAGRTLSRSYR
jgi:hypothetical protein